MGGSVTVVIKKENCFTSLDSYTGYYQKLLYGVESLSNDLDASIANYIAHSEPSGCSPNGYGLVFFDFDRKEVHGLQDYDLAGTVMGFEIHMRGMKGLVTTGLNPLEEFILQDKVDVLCDDKQTSISDFFKTDDRVALVNLLKKSESFDIGGVRHSLLFINFVLKGWKVFSYEKDPEDIIKLFDLVRGAVTQSDLDNWKEKIEEVMDYYETEDDISDMSDDEQDKYYENCLELFKQKIKL